MIASLEGMIGQSAEVVHHPAHKADMLANLADISKARKMLGWEPKVGLQEGMQAPCRLVYGRTQLGQRTWSPIE